MKTTTNTKDKSKKKNKDKADELLKLGIQFGHKKSRRHPSMTPYIYGKRNDMYIIDIEKFQEKFLEALKFIQSLVKDNKKIVFIGTKPNVVFLIYLFLQRLSLIFVSVWVMRLVESAWTENSIMKADNHNLASQ